MRKILYQLILIIFGFFSSCQPKIYAQDQLKIDSIKTLNAVENNQKILAENNNKIAYLFGSINIDSSLFYSNQSRLIAKNIGYTKALAVSYSFTARAMIQKGDFNLAIENFNNALDLFKIEKDSINILDSYRGMSYVASYSSSQFKSLDYNLKALNYAEGLKDTVSLSIIYNNIGSIYKKLENYNYSLEYFKKSLRLELTKQDGPNSDLAVLYSNIGVLKVENNRFKEASEDYENVIKLLPNLESLYLKPYLFLSLSGYYIANKDFKLAEKYIDSATTILEKHDFKQIKSRAYRKKAEWYFYQNLFRESINYFDKCLAYSKSINVYEEFPEIYKKRAEAYSKIGLFKEAFYSLKKADDAIDSLKNNSVASFLRDFEDQERKNELQRHALEQSLKDQQLENESIKKKILVGSALIAILTLLFIIGIVVYYFFKVRKNNKVLKQQHETIYSQKLLLESTIETLEIKEEKLQKLNATKDKLFSIIAHDLKSPFNAILGFSKLLAENYDSYNDAKRKGMISEVETASENAFNLLENLLNWTRSQRGIIEIKKEKHNLKSVLDTSILPYLSSASMKGITVKNNVNEDVEVCVDSDTIKIAFSNLVSNAIKFSELGDEIIVTTKLHSNNIEICFQDSGVGMDKTIIEGLFKIEKDVKRKGTSNENGTGLGLILCYEFIEKNNGKIRVESTVGLGSKFYVSLPIKCIS